MSDVSFTVSNIESGVANTKYGVKPTYTLVAQETGEKYRLGFTNPAKLGIAVGTVVNGSVSVTKYGTDLDAKTVRIGGSVVPAAASPVSSVPGPARKAFAEKVFPVPLTHGDMAIIRQNALTNAVSTVADFIATQQADKWPTLEVWTDMVINTAYKYSKFSSGQRETDALEKLQKAGVEATEIHTAMEAHLKGDTSEAA